LKNDRENKGLAYARAGIIQYLLINLNNNTIENYRQPNFEGYQNKETYHGGDILTLNAFSDIQIEISELLPEQS